ncbi:MAG: hypothetical protein ACRCYO_13535 [Bacteroidia bacterium]
MKKIKFLPSGEIGVVYFMTNPDTGKRRKIDMEFDLMPHVDLCEAVKALAPFMAEAMDLFAHRPKFKLNPERKARWEAVEDILKTLDGEVIASVIPKGIIIKGEGDSMNVKIVGNYKTKTQEVAMNTPKIFKDSDSFGFEDKLFMLIDRVIAEAKEYAINEKSSQLKLDLEEVSKKAS